MTLFALAGLLGGCERGCLSTWIRGKASDPQASPLAPLSPSATPASCPGGLARCVGGSVFASRHVDFAGPCSPEGCRCPWDDAGVCALGCTVDGLELGVDADQAARQLCAPAANDPPPATPWPQGLELDGGLSADAEASEPLCDIERFRCLDGVLYGCDGAPHPLARCTKGCAPGEGSLFDPMAPETAAALLCAR